MVTVAKNYKIIPNRKDFSVKLPNGQIVNGFDDRGEAARFIKRNRESLKRDHEYVHAFEPRQRKDWVG